MLKTVLSVDIGTTSLKAGLITATGEVVFISKVRFSNPQNRYIANNWKLALSNAVRKLRRFVDFSNIQIEGIAVSGNGPTVVTQSGFTLRWNEDFPLSQEEKSAIGHSLFLPKIVAMKNNFPKEFSSSPLIFSGPEFLIYQLTDSAITILPEKRFLPAYWENEQLALPALNINPAKFPEFVAVGELCGNLSADAAKVCQLPVGLPVFAGGPDFVVALIGTGTLENGRLCDRCGSSEGLNFCVDKFITAPGIRTLPSVITGLWNLSVLIPGSSKMRYEVRLEKIRAGVNLLRKIAAENNIPFSAFMAVTGGQTKDPELLEKKAKVTGLNVKVGKCNDCELLGDACAAWKGLGVYGSLREAAAEILK